MSKVKINLHAANNQTFAIRIGSSKSLNGGRARYLLSQCRTLMSGGSGAPRNPQALFALAVWATCLLAGCSRGPANVAPVEGLVLFNGLPARAGIVTQGLDEKGRPTGRPSNADTRADGTFALAYSENQPGALLGSHRVTVSVFPLERAEGELGFQQRFRPVKVVRLTRQVKAGTTNRWNFVLTY